VIGYSLGQTIVEVLKRCGNDLSRDNLLKQATSIRQLQLSMLIAGITINVTAENRRALHQVRLAQYDGKQWSLFGDVIDDRSDTPEPH